MKTVLPNISPQLTSLLWSLKAFEKKEKVNVKDVFSILLEKDPSYKNFWNKFPGNTFPGNTFPEGFKEIDLRKLVEMAFFDAFEDASTQVGVEHLFLAMASLLGRDEYERAKVYVISRRGEAGLKRKFLLDIVSDITSMEELGMLPDVVIREKETNLLIQKLLQSQRGNILLVGPKGVGKTALLHGLAKKIVNWDVPKDLIGMRIVSIDIVALANAPFSIRGYLEDNLSNIVGQGLGTKGKILLFFDNLHLLPAGMSFGMSAGPGRKYVRFVGAAEDTENLRIIESPFGALWEPFNIGEPSLEDTEKILNMKAQELSKVQHMTITKPALDEMLNWNLNLLYPTQAMPGKLLEILDRICAKKKLTDKPVQDLVVQNKKLLVLKKKFRKALQRRVLSSAATLDRQIKKLENDLYKKELWTQRKVKIDQLDVRRFLESELGPEVIFSKVLNNLEKSLSESVVGQKEAILSLVSAIKRSSLKLKGKNRPIGAFLFLGASGVGKTETAKVLARILFGEGRKFIRLDMSDFRERHTVSRLVGAPPGYIGFEEGGQLTEFVAENPRSVVLFDEIEKAHTDVLNILLQVMEEGELIDGSGMKVSFKDTVVILTGNIGSDLIGKGEIGFSSLSTAGPAKYGGSSGTQSSFSQGTCGLYKGLRTNPNEKAIDTALASLSSAADTRLGKSPNETSAGVPLLETCSPVTRLQQSYSYEVMKERIIEEAKKILKPEFLNRFDDIIVFRILDKGDLYKICSLLIKEFKKSLEEKGIGLKITALAKKYLVGKSFSIEYGARPLRRLIEREVIDKVANMILENKLNTGNTAVVSLDKDGIIVRI